MGAGEVPHGSGAAEGEVSESALELVGEVEEGTATDDVRVTP